MQVSDMNRIVMSHFDHERIERLLAAQSRRRDGSVLEALGEELERAEVVDRAEVPSDVVVIGSRVRFIDETNDRLDEVTVVLPADAEPGQGRVSILTPIGSALIGLRVGQRIDWPFPTGARRLRVVAVDHPDL